MTREDALFFLNRFRRRGINEKLFDALGVAMEALENERPKGHWIRKSVDNGWHADWVCSECGHRVYFDHIYYDYCPRCGAYMRSEVCERDTDYEQAVAQLEHDMRYDPTYNPEDGSA